jgi:hypothetical protein
MATASTSATRRCRFDYALGYTSAEHDRLIRQATRIAPITERLFPESGIGPGQRVLDLGSGVGDVAMLTLVMPSLFDPQDALVLWGKPGDGTGSLQRVPGGRTACAGNAYGDFAGMRRGPHRIEV